MKKVQRWCDACCTDMSDGPYVRSTIKAIQVWETVGSNKDYDLCLACAYAVRRSIDSVIEKIKTDGKYIPWNY